MHARVPQEPGRSRHLHREVELPRGAHERSGGAGKSECLVVPAKRGSRPEGPRGGKGAPGHGTVGGKDDGDIGLRTHLHETRADSEQRTRDLKSRMREIRTSGSVGGRGLEPPRPTRLVVRSASDLQRLETETPAAPANPWARWLGPAATAGTPWPSLRDRGTRVVWTRFWTMRLLSSSERSRRAEGTHRSLSPLASAKRSFC